MKKTTNKSRSHLNSPTLLLLVLVAAIGALLYFQFLIRPSNRGDLIPYIMVIMAESYVIFQALVAMWTILAGTQSPRNFEFSDAQAHLFTDNSHRVTLEEVLTHKRREANRFPMYMSHKQITVDVLITVYGEPLEDIRKTAIAARDMAGVHETFILDDGGSAAVKSLARHLNIGYIRRKSSAGAKAGNINNALIYSKAEFFVVFDADFVAKKHFLYETLPFFEDEKVAFVQTPQHYSNLRTIISKGASYMQYVFYRLIQPGKNRFNAAFCVGTNVVFRRSAVDSVGGIYDGSKSEDIWTSILLHEKGFRSIFIPEVLAIGQTPDTIKAYSKQQLRWATGAFQILLNHNPLRRRSLTLDQKLQYFHTATYYLHGFAILLLFMLPPLNVYFGLSPVAIQLGFLVWLAFYLMFYGTQIVLAFYTMGAFRLETIVMAMASFPIYIRAFINALRNKEEAWQATGSHDKIDSPFNYIVPQIMLFIFMTITAFVAGWKVYYYETPSLALFWSAANSLLLGAFLVIATKEHFRLRREVRNDKRASRRQIKVVDA